MLSFFFFPLFSHYSQCRKWQLIISKNQSHNFMLLRLLKWWKQFGSFNNTPGPHLSMFWGDKMERQPSNHSSPWRRRYERDANCLNMAQFALTQWILIEKKTHANPVFVRRCAAEAESAWNHCPFLKRSLWQLYDPSFFDFLTNKRVSPGAAAAPLLWKSPNPFSLGLSISGCRVYNALPRCHYCTITYQIPPVYYRHRFLSAVINDSSTAADEKEYWLTEEVRRLRIAQTLAVFYLSFFIWRYFSSSVANWDTVCSIS